MSMISGAVQYSADGASLANSMIVQQARIDCQNFKMLQAPGSGQYGSVTLDGFEQMLQSPKTTDDEKELAALALAMDNHPIRPGGVASQLGQMSSMTGAEILVAWTIAGASPASMAQVMAKIGTKVRDTNCDVFNLQDLTGDVLQAIVSSARCTPQQREQAHRTLEQTQVSPPADRDSSHEVLSYIQRTRAAEEARGQTLSQMATE